METFTILLVVILSASFLLSGCASANKTRKGAVVGTAAGGALGAVIGMASGNTALGAIIGAAAGGATGAIIGHQMDKRASSVSAYLACKGVTASRMTTKGFGETIPKYDNMTAESRSLNRRVEFLISAKKK